MKTQLFIALIFIALLSVSYAGGDDCDCGKGFYKESTKMCEKNPMKGKPGFVENCMKYEDDDGELECDDCMMGYYKKDDKCMKATAITDCMEYEWDGSKAICDECKDGKYYDSATNTCKTPGTAITNCVKYDSATECDECKENYAKKTDNTACYANPTGNSAITDCAAYMTTDGTTFMCQFCMNGKQANAQFTACEAPPSAVTGCIAYYSNNCVYCGEGKYVDGSACKTCPKKIADDKDGDGEGNSGSSLLSAGVLLLLGLVALLA